MIAPAWDAAAARTLRAAEALFAASDLGWVEPAAWAADPWVVFERLIRAALAARAGTPTSTAPASVVAEAWPRPERSRPFTPPPAARTRVWPTAPPAVAPMAAAAPLRSVPPAAAATLARPAGAATLQAPAVGRAARIGALTQRRLSTPAPALAARPTSAPAFDRGAALHEPARPAAPPVAASALAAPSPESATAIPTPRTPALRLLDTPPSPAIAAALPTSRRVSLRPIETAAAETAGPAAGAASREGVDPRPMRLVEGLPALQGLLQAAVADSRARHAPRAPGPVAPAPNPALPIAGPPALAAAVAPLRALPQLDAVAEDMLVDRLADRLQERLREQALRQFGFTGGLN